MLSWSRCGFFCSACGYRGGGPLEADDDDARGGLPEEEEEDAENANDFAFKPLVEDPADTTDAATNPAEEAGNIMGKQSTEVTTNNPLLDVGPLGMKPDKDGFGIARTAVTDVSYNFHAYFMTTFILSCLLILSTVFGCLAGFSGNEGC